MRIKVQVDLLTIIIFMTMRYKETPLTSVIIMFIYVLYI